jgi:hypothetical protein
MFKGEMYMVNGYRVLRRGLLLTSISLLATFGAVQMPAHAIGDLTVAVIGCSGGGPFSCIGFDGGSYECSGFIPSGSGGSGIGTGCSK